MSDEVSSLISSLCLLYNVDVGYFVELSICIMMWNWKDGSVIVGGYVS